MQFFTATSARMSAMAWSVFDDLVAEGVPAKNIHSDVFDYAPR